MRSIRRTRFKTILMIDHIDKAVEKIERRRQQQGREVEYKACLLYTSQEVAKLPEDKRNIVAVYSQGVLAMAQAQQNTCLLYTS